MSKDQFVSSDARAAQRKTLTEILLNVKPGEVIPYDEISRKAGFSVREQPAYGVLSYTKHKLIKDFKVVFGLVKGAGLIRLTSQGILAMARSRSESLVRKTYKDTDILLAITRSELDDAGKEEYDKLLKNASFHYAIAQASSKGEENNVDKMIPHIHYPKRGPEIGPVLRGIFGSKLRKVEAVPKEKEATAAQK